jgi:hypothetical protein
MRRLAALALLLLAGCSEKKLAAGLDFAAYGDCRHQPAVHRRVANSIAASGARFTLVTGDLVDTPEDPAAWAEFRDIVKELRKKPYDCAVGDHDPGEKLYFKKELGLDRLYYDRKDGDFHIFVLDSSGKFADKDQVDWLEKTAAASTAKHKIAVMHHTPYSIKASRVAEAEELRPKIHPLLVKLKFCAAMCGHVHAFYTTLRDGVRYVVTAGGGAPLYSIDASLGQPGDLSRKFHHFVGFKIAGSRIEGHVYDPDGVEDEALAFPLCEHP